jgi:hypothetical protein
MTEEFEVIEYLDEFIDEVQDSIQEAHTEVINSVDEEVCI